MPHRGLASTWGLAMLRAVVLVLCLASAGGIAAYSLYSRGDTGEPVYTVPSPSSTPAPHEPTASEPKRIAPDDQPALTRELQRELKRVGCYNGEISGVWTTSSRLAMKTFVERVNAALPIDKPDPVLLSLVQVHRERACGVGCPGGQTEQAGGACVPSAVAATAKEPPPDAAKAGAAAAAAGAAAGMALAAPGAGAVKQDAKAPAPEAASQGGSAPPDAKPAKRPRRSAQTPQPPKLVRDVMKALGIK